MEIEIGSPHVHHTSYGGCQNKSLTIFIFYRFHDVIENSLHNNTTSMGALAQILVFLADHSRPVLPLENSIFEMEGCVKLSTSRSDRLSPG